MVVRTELCLIGLPTSQTILGLPGSVWLWILVLIAVCVFVYRMSYLLRLLRLGRAENRADHLVGRVNLFLREVIGQSRIWSGDAIIRWAHPLIFWGFCLFVLASALMFIGAMFEPILPTGWHVPQVEEIPVLGTAVDLLAILVLVGLAASSVRRYFLTPDGLQRTYDASLVVILIAILMITFLLVEAGGHVARDNVANVSAHGQTWLPAGTFVAKTILAVGLSPAGVVDIGNVSWWIHLMILLFFLVYLPYSKHMHLIWAPFAVFLGELPSDKGVLQKAEEAGEIATADNGSNTPGSQLGVFSWRQLLNAFTCAECGRCDRACPANQSGAPLSPREVVHDLKAYLLKHGKRALGGNINGNGNGKMLVGDIVGPDRLWACTSCHACQDVCPVRNEHVPLIVQMRRGLIEQGELDASLQETLTSLQRYGNSQGKSPRKRFEWAKGLEPPIRDVAREPAETLWFLGDYAAYHPTATRVSRMVAEIFHAMELDFGCLLKSERSAGNDVRRVGEEGLFEMLAEQNVAALKEAEFQRIVTTDPHTYHVLKHEYAVWGMNKPVFHFCEVVDAAIRNEELTVRTRIEGTAVLHDACYLGRYNGIYDPPRRVVDALGLRRVEMPRSRGHSFCCGGGGGRIWMEDDDSVTERPAINRIREALALEQVTHFVVTCPKDLNMFEDAVKTVGAEDRLRVVDLAELVYEAIQ